MTSGLSHDERYFFDLTGYLVLDGVLSSGEVARLNRALDAIPDLGQPGHDIASQRVGELLERGPEFLGPMTCPPVMRVLRELVGPRFRLDHAYAIRMAPGTSGLGLHNGATPADPSQSYTFRDGTISNGLVAVSFALGDSRPGDGGFGCLPGSHKSNFPLPQGVAGYQRHPDWVREVPHQAGSALIFTEALTHGTLPWRGAAERRALIYKYCPGFMAWAEWRPLPPHVANTLTPEQRRLVRPPSVAGSAG